MTDLAPSEIREFLRRRSAVLVHFSTVMASHNYVFPDDLVNAAALSGAALSFSTILPGDTGPHVGKGGAEGSVGLVIDIGPGTTVESVWHQDAGANEFGAFGGKPSELTCAESIDRRVRSNEWRVRGYVSVGLFVVNPIIVRKMLDAPGGPSPFEQRIELDEAIAAFGSQRIFSVSPSTFIEFDKATSQWKAVAYDDLVAARW